MTMKCNSVAVRWVGQYFIATIQTHLGQCDVLLRQRQHHGGRTVTLHCRTSFIQHQKKKKKMWFVIEVLRVILHCNIYFRLSVV